MRRPAYMYSEEAFMLNSRSGTFHRAKIAAFPAGINVTDDKGSMELTHEGNLTSRVCQFANGRPKLSVGRTGKVSFRRRRSKIIPNGSHPRYGQRTDGSWGVTTYDGGDEEDPRVTGEHEIDSSILMQWGAIPIKI